MTAIFRHIGLSLLALVIAAASLQPTSSSDISTAAISQNSCITKALLQDQPVDNLQELLEVSGQPEETTSHAATSSSCQSVCPFLATSYELDLPRPSISGRTGQSPASQYALLFDDRSSDPPRHYS